MRGMFPTTTTALLLVVLAFSAVDAQELPVKRELPAGSDQLCPVPSREPGPSNGPEPSPEELARADALTTQGDQAAILGDHLRARAVLEEAAGLNPGSAAVAYRLARSLEALGAPREAQLEYCRYLALADEPSDRVEVEGRIAVLATQAMGGLSPTARRSFEEGLRAYDAGDLEGGVRAFTTAISESPEWPDSHYNRGVLRIALERMELGAADLERYLELAGDPDDRVIVQARLAEMRERLVAARSPGTAFATGLLVPGLGHFYTDRTWAGMSVVALAGASIATGYLYREIEVACRIPVQGDCPPDQVASRTETRPHLTTGLAGAAAVTFLGAVHAYVGARSARAASGAASAPPDPSAGRGFASIDWAPIYDPRDASAGLSVTLRF